MNKSVTEKLKNTLRLNTIVTAFLVAAGLASFIFAFGTEGSQFDLYEYCFKPPQFTDPKSESEYCTLDKRYKGVTWIIASERESNPELNKATFIRGIKATKPYSGWYGLSSAGCFLLAYTIWSATTNYYVVLLHSTLREQEKRIIENAVIHKNGLDLLMRKELLEKELVEDVQNRQQAERLYRKKSPTEKQVLAEQFLKQKELDELALHLKKSTIQAETAEQDKRKWEANLDALKAKAKAQDDLWGDGTPKEDEPLTKESLKKLLKSHEDGWLWELVCNRKPLWVIGAQGSFKSNFASCLVMCRYLFNGWKLASISDPQFHQNSKPGKPWEPLITLEPEVYGQTEDGSGFDWEGVGNAMESAFDRWSNRTESDPIIQSIWDEVTNYSSNVALTDKWALRLNSDPRKANEAIILLSHGKSKIATGGGDGLKETKEENSLFLRLGSRNDQSPTFKGRLEGWKDDNGELLEEKKVTIPKEWFNTVSISALLNSPAV